MTEAPPITIPELLPYSFRLPATGQRDPWFGCSRTFWAQWIAEHPGPECSFVFRRSGDKRGIRLLFYAAARAFIERERARYEVEWCAARREQFQTSKVLEDAA